MLLALALSALAVPAWAQGYPSKPVRVIVTFPPGGTPDIYGRVMSIELGKLWNQSVVVENRTGAGGTIGTDFVAKAAPTAIRCSSPRTRPSPSRRTCIRTALRSGARPGAHRQRRHGAFRPHAIPRSRPTA